MTSISRVFGYVRDAVVLIFFANPATDAFLVAFRIPNLLRRLFAEGGFAQAFVPVFSDYRENRDAVALKDLVDHVTGTLTLVLTGVTVLGILAAPLLISLFAPGFEGGEGRFELATQMLRITFPYILFISLTALAGGILNSFGRFAVPAFTPVFLNLSLIIAAIWLSAILATPVLALAWGVFAAGLAQLAFQVPFVYRLGLLPLPRFKRAHEGVRRIMGLMLPAIFGSSVVQINLLFDTLIASYLAVGSISWLYISDRFVELPLAIFGIATATVILPRLSRQVARQSGRDFMRTLDWALRVSLLVAVPATLGLVILAGPILVTLVQYVEFDAADTRMAMLSLFAYSAGLPAFIGIKVLAPGFYARQDTKTPVKIGIIAMLANMVLNVVLVVGWRYAGLPGPHAGLALATALSAYLNAGLLYRQLVVERVFSHQPEWGRLAGQVLLATATMIILVLVLTPPLADWQTWHIMHRALTLTGLITAGTITYLLALYGLGARPWEFSLQETAAD